MYSLFRRWLALLANALYVLQIKFTCMVYQWYIVWYRFICVSTWSRNWICTQYSNPSKKKVEHDRTTLSPRRLRCPGTAVAIAFAAVQRSSLASFCRWLSPWDLWIWEALGPETWCLRICWISVIFFWRFPAMPFYFLPFCGYVRFMFMWPQEVKYLKKGSSEATEPTSA